MRSYESPSSIGNYIQCPKSYYFTYIDKPDIEAEDHLYFLMGTAFHGAMEYLYSEVKNLKVPELKSVLTAFEDAWKEGWNDGFPKEEFGLTAEEYKHAGVEAIKRYHKTFYPFATGDVMLIEKDINFCLEDDKYKVKCKLDRVMNMGGGKFEIHDYKTSKNPSSETELKQDIQPVLYCMALKGFSKDIKQVNLVWHYVRSGLDVPFTFSEKELEAHKQDIISTYRKIQSENYEMNIGTHCNYCDFASVCPARVHPKKVEALPVKEQKKEDGVKLVDQLTKILEDKKEYSAKVEEFDTKIEEVKKLLVDYAKKFNFAVVKGTKQSAKVSITKDIAFPGKNDPEMEKLAKKLKELGLWEQLSTLDPYILKDLIKSKKLPEKIEKEISKFAKEKENTRVTLSANKEEEKE